MTTVRISQQLKFGIISMAKMVYEDRLKVAGSPHILPYDAVSFYDMLVEPWRAQIDALPHEFFSSITGIKVMNTGVAGRLDVEVLKLPHSMAFPKQFPSSYDVYVSPGIYTYEVRITLRDSPRWQPVLHTFREREGRHSLLTAERDAFVGDIRALLAAHSTINAAVKTCPALRELLPSSVKAELDAPMAVSRRKSASAGPTNISRITAVLAAKKIL